jgi:hypothetical protein
MFARYRGGEVLSKLISSFCDVLTRREMYPAKRIRHSDVCPRPVQETIDIVRKKQVDRITDFDLMGQLRIERVGMIDQNDKVLNTSKYLAPQRRGPTYDHFHTYGAGAVVGGGDLKILGALVDTVTIGENADDGEPNAYPRFENDVTVDVPTKREHREHQRHQADGNRCPILQEAWGHGACLVYGVRLTSNYTASFCCSSFGIRRRVCQLAIKKRRELLNSAPWQALR